METGYRREDIEIAMKNFRKVFHDSHLRPIGLTSECHRNESITCPKLNFAISDTKTFTEVAYQASCHISKNSFTQVYYFNYKDPLTNHDLNIHLG